MKTIKLILVAALFLSAGAVSAEIAPRWLPPQKAAPACAPTEVGCWPPINVSSVTQQKIGPLDIKYNPAVDGRTYGFKSLLGAGTAENLGPTSTFVVPILGSSDSNSPGGIGVAGLGGFAGLFGGNNSSEGYAVWAKQQGTGYGIYQSGLTAKNLFEGDVCTLNGVAGGQPTCLSAGGGPVATSTDSAWELIGGKLLAKFSNEGSKKIWFELQGVNANHPTLALSGNTAQGEEGLRLHYNQDMKVGVLDVRGDWFAIRGVSSPTTGDAGSRELAHFDLRNGNVGIGTADARVKLSVGGVIHASGDIDPNTTRQGAYLGWNALTGGTGETDFINNQGEGSGGFAFFNTPVGGSPRSLLAIISGSGNVGIGTADPKARLEVNGDIISGGSNSWIYHTPDDGRLSLHIAPRGAGSDWDWGRGMSIGADEQVGVVRASDFCVGTKCLSQTNVGPTTAPTLQAVTTAGNNTGDRVLLHGAGVGDDGGYGGNLVITNPAGQNPYINLIRAGNKVWTLGFLTNAADPNTFAIGDGGLGGAALAINNTGNVGIGTTNPQDKLNVNGKIQAEGDVCTSLNGGKCLKDVAVGPTGTPTLQAVTDEGNTTNKDITMGSVLGMTNRGHIQTGEDLYLNPWKGRVKVGFGGGPESATAGYLDVEKELSVNGGARVGGDLTAENNFLLGGSNSWLFHSPDDGRQDLFLAHKNPAGNWDFGAGLTFKGDTGNVGIGTDNPRQKLDVVGSAIIEGAVIQQNAGAQNYFTGNVTIGAEAMAVDTVKKLNVSGGVRVQPADNPYPLQLDRFQAPQTERKQPLDFNLGRNVVTVPNTDLVGFKYQNDPNGYWMWGVDNVTNQFKVIRKIPGANPREFLSLAPDTGALNLWADLPDTSPPGTLCGSLTLSPVALVIPIAAITPDYMVPCKGRIPGMDVAQIFNKLQQTNNNLRPLLCWWKNTPLAGLAPCLLDNINPGAIADVIEGIKAQANIPWGCPSGYQAVTTGANVGAASSITSLSISCAKK